MVTIAVHEIIEFGALGFVLGFTIGFAAHGVMVLLEGWLAR